MQTKHSHTFKTTSLSPAVVARANQLGSPLPQAEWDSGTSISSLIPSAFDFLDCHSPQPQTGMGVRSFSMTLGYRGWRLGYGLGSAAGLSSRGWLCLAIFVCLTVAALLASAWLFLLSVCAYFCVQISGDIVLLGQSHREI